jgi:hypothetical protein
MTVIIEKPAINLREELADLRNQGTYQEQQFYFDSLVTNGTFDTNVSGWTADATYGGTLTHDTTVFVGGGLKITHTGSYSGAYQAITTTIGKRYVVTASFDKDGVTQTCSLEAASTATYNSGRLAAQENGANDTGSLAITFVATGTTTYIHVNGDSGVSRVHYWDNISVFEVDANDDVVHRMPKGWVPQDVFEDGLLQREGAANDYTVVYDGFDYYVKPAVAPSITTQTCVVGVRK